MRAKWKLFAVLLALATAVAFLPALAFADDEEEEPFEVYTSAHYTDMEEGEDSLNSGQAVPGMGLCLCADVDDGTENPDGYDYFWELKGISDRLENYDPEMFVTFDDGFMEGEDVFVTFTPWEEIISKFNGDEEKEAELNEALRDGFTAHFEVTVNNEDDQVVRRELDIDINDEYAELCPVNEDFLSDMESGEDYEFTPSFDHITGVDNNGKHVREKFENVEFTWVKGSPWGIVEDLDDETKQAIETAYKNEDYVEEGEDYDWDDERYAFEYLYKEELLPLVSDNDPDVSITDEDDDGTFTITRKSDEDFEITLLAACEEWNDGNPDWRRYYVDEADDNGDDDDDAWRVCFDGDSDYEWAHFYSVDGQDGTLTEEDLNITVEDEEGNIVPAENYDLILQQTYYDEGKDEDVYVDVEAPYGLAAIDKNEESGFTEYVAVVKGEGNETKAKDTFFIMDKYSLNWICANVEFEGAWAKDSWRGCDWSWVSQEDLKAPVVKASDGTQLTSSVCEITYYTRSGDPEDMNDPGHDRDEFIKADAAHQLDGLPTEEGQYFLTLEAKGGTYYGGTTVLLDVSGPQFNGYSSKGDPLDDGDTLYIAPVKKDKVFVAFYTNGDLNAKAGLAPIVGFYDGIEQNGKITGDLSDAGFTVTTGTAEELGYDGDEFEKNAFGLEIDATGLSLGKSATLRYFLYKYEGDDFWEDFESGAFNFSEAEVAYTKKLNVVVAEGVNFNNHDAANDKPLSYTGTKTYNMSDFEEAEKEGDIEFHMGEIKEDNEVDSLIDLTAENGYKNEFAEYDKENHTLTLYGEPIFKKYGEWNLHIRGWINNRETGKLIAIGHANCWVKGPCPLANPNVLLSVKHGPLTKVEKKDATCTEDGVKLEHWVCEACGTCFADAEGDEWIMTAKCISPAKGHKLTETKAKAATCTEAGNSAYWYCGTCEKYFGDAEGTKEIKKDSWIIPATGHNAVVTKAKLASDQDSGNTEYWTCTNCGKYFSEKECENEIEQYSWVIPMITMSVSAKKKSFAAKHNTKTVLKARNVYVVKGNPGEMTYKKKSGIGKITVSRNGDIKVKKGLKKKRSYTIKVIATSDATDKYEAISKVVTVKIKIK